MKDNKGITLIALVITIIVLIILAGVAIAMLSGDQSIFNRTGEAVAVQELGLAKDQAVIEAQNAQAEYFHETYVGDSNASYNNQDLNKKIYDAITTTTGALTSDGKLKGTKVEVVALGDGTKADTMYFVMYYSNAYVKGKISQGKVEWVGQGYDKDVTSKGTASDTASNNTTAVGKLFNIS